jgi:hypothetical protein
MFVDISVSDQAECSWKDDGTLWIHSVPQEIVNSVSDQEKRRQEAINEVIYTERDFVRDMEYLRDVSDLLHSVHIVYIILPGLDQPSEN